MKYIISGGFGVPVFYRCSQCKHINRFYHPIKITTLSRKFDDKYTAKERHQFQLSLYRDEVWKEAQVRRYRKVKYKTKCAACGHQEPWSKLRFGILEDIPYIFLYLSVFMLIPVIALIEQQSWLGLGAVIASYLLFGFVVPVTVKMTLRSKREKEIEQLDYAYHPVICWREEDEEKIIQEISDRACSVSKDEG